MEKNNVKSKITGLLIAIMAIILLIVINACTVYKQPQVKITSVLAVTAEGDTLKLPIDVIRPIYNYNNYPRSYYPYNNFYYTPNRYYPSYNGNYSNNSNGYSSSNNNNNNSSNSTPSVAPIRPSSSGVAPPPPPTAVNNPRKKN
jgi:hypothetical protein